MRLPILPSSVAIVLISSFNALAESNVYDWVQWQGHSYAVSFQLQTWEEAQANAESMGATLAVINNAEEDSFLRDTFVVPFSSGFWIGALQGDGAAEPSGGWTWVNNEPWTFTNWRPSEPNNNNGARYAYIDIELIGWADETGGSPYYAIFEIGSPPVPTVSVWGLIAITLTILTFGSLLLLKHEPSSSWA